MLVRFTKQPPAATVDTLTCIRPDGSRAEAALPRQGILPAMAFHFVIESALGWSEGVFGGVRRGAALAAPATTTARSRAKRPHQLQMAQAAALVSCLQAEQSGGSSAHPEFLRKLASASRKNNVTPPVVGPADLTRLRLALRAFGAAWRPLVTGAAIERQFEA